MNLNVVRFHDIPPHLLERWAQWQAADPALASPCFHPHFTRAVAGARADVFVGVLDEGAAFLPFQRQAWAIGEAVGAPLSDYHGLIGGGGRGDTMEEVVRACGLRAWDFDHVPAVQTDFDAWSASRADSPVLDLTKAVAVGSAKLRTDAANRRRKLEREFGRIEFEMRSLDAAAFQQLLAWKSSQYVETGQRDLFAVPWIRAVIDAIRQEHAPEFSGWLSVLRAGGRPVAAHFGMRSRGVLHYWFPGYDASLGTYSPGILLLLAIIDAAPEHGISLIDFGKGDAFYKKRLANSAVPLLEGSVIAAPWVGALRRARAGAGAWVRRGPLLQPARMVGRWLRRDAH